MNKLVYTILFLTMPFWVIPYILLKPSGKFHRFIDLYFDI